MADYGNYQVKKGDTLWHVAKNELKKTGNAKPTNAQIVVAMKKIAEANGCKDAESCANKFFNKIGSELKVEGLFVEKQSPTFVDFEDGATRIKDSVNDSINKIIDKFLDKFRGKDGKIDMEAIRKWAKEHPVSSETTDEIQNGDDIGAKLNDFAQKIKEGKFNPADMEKLPKGLRELITQILLEPLNHTTAALHEGGSSGKTTKALGEEGGSRGGITTMATNEEGGSVKTTLALGEEGGTEPPKRNLPIDPTDISKLIGEDGGSVMTTLAIGEEGGANPTKPEPNKPIDISKLIGEDGGSVKTTLALGEEGGTAPVKPEPKEPINISNLLSEDGGNSVKQTTYALGEEGGGITTAAIGEEGGNNDSKNKGIQFPKIDIGKATTYALGEEGGQS